MSRILIPFLFPAAACYLDTSRDDCRHENRKILQPGIRDPEYLDVEEEICMQRDKFFLALALQSAKMGRFTTSPNPSVGCIIVRDDRIIGRGCHRRTGDRHAEIDALSSAQRSPAGSTVYVTLEPCSHTGKTPPCVDALVRAEVSRVVVSSVDPNPRVSGRGIDMLRKSGITVDVLPMSSELRELNRGFFKRMNSGVPFVSLKMASSIDGRTATCSGESKWITSQEARSDVQRLRAENDVVLSTASTILHDDPQLNVRWSSLPRYIQDSCQPDDMRQPIRMIVDSRNRVTTDHRVIRKPGRVELLRLSHDNKEWPSHVSQIILPPVEIFDRKYVNLNSLMSNLGGREINSVLIESGPEFAGAVLNLNLVDEIILYQSAKLLGSDGRSLFNLPKISSLDEAIELSITEVWQIGPDVRFRLELSRKEDRLEGKS